MIFIIFCFFVNWMKVTSAGEGLRLLTEVLHLALESARQQRAAIHMATDCRECALGIMLKGGGRQLDWSKYVNQTFTRTNFHSTSAFS